MKAWLVDTATTVKIATDATPVGSDCKLALGIYTANATSAVVRIEDVCVR